VIQHIDICLHLKIITLFAEFDKQAMLEHSSEGANSFSRPMTQNMVCQRFESESPA